MQINIRTKGVTLSAECQEYVEKKLLTLEKYYKEGDTDTCQAHIVVEKNTEKDGANVAVEVRIAIGKKVFLATEKGSTIEESIDLIHDKLKIQLQRNREKMKEHHA